MPITARSASSVAVSASVTGCGPAAGDAQVGAPEAVDGDRVGGVGELQREREIVGVVGGDRVGYAVGGRHVLHGASLPSLATLARESAVVA